MKLAGDVTWLDCEIVHVSPPVYAVGAWPTQVEVLCRVLMSVSACGGSLDQTTSLCMARRPFGEQHWDLSVRASPDGLAVSNRLLPASCTLGRLPCEALLTFRFQMPVGVAGIFSITVVPSGQVQQSKVFSNVEAPAFLPLVTATSGTVFVAPSAAVAEELLGMFNRMRSVVAAQSQEQAQKNQLQLPDSDSNSETTVCDTAAITCWCEHFHPLLQDLQQVLLGGSCTAAAIVGSHPEAAVGSLCREPVELVFCSLVEFMAMHGCWCGVSHLLAEAHKSGLLHSPDVAAIAQSKQLDAVMHCGLAGLQTAAGLSASLILSVTAAEQPGVTAAEELEMTAAESLINSSSKVTVHNITLRAQVDAAAAGSTAGHSTTATLASLQSCRTKETASSMVALLVLVLLTAAAPAMQSVLLDTTSSSTASADDAAQLPLQYCALLMAVLLTMMVFSFWSSWSGHRWVCRE